MKKVDSLSVKQIISQEEYEKEIKKRIRCSSKLSREERERRLQLATKKPEQVQTLVAVYKRNADVIVTVLERAKGICEECKQPAPFIRSSDGTPYLEVHHCIPLGYGGEDTVDNAVALCPNCHRKAHFGR